LGVCRQSNQILFGLVVVLVLVLEIRIFERDEDEHDDETDEVLFGEYSL